MRESRTMWHRFLTMWHRFLTGGVAGTVRFTLVPAVAAGLIVDSAAVTAEMLTGTVKWGVDTA